MSRLTRLILDYSIPIIAGAYSIYTAENQGISKVHTQIAYEKAQVSMRHEDPVGAGLDILLGYTKRAFVDFVAFGLVAAPLAPLSTRIIRSLSTHSHDKKSTS